MLYDDDCATPQAVLDFWFGELTPQNWFTVGPAVDAEIARRFTTTHLVLSRNIDANWRMTPENRLAAIVVLDQFARNLYRKSPLAFATDGLALNEARTAVDAGMDQAVEADRRAFFYFPFEHSERLEDQERSVGLFAALGDENYLDYARRHRDVVAEFGRFPHRNPILGRHSTLKEEAYLAEPGAGF